MEILITNLKVNLDFDETKIFDYTLNKYHISSYDVEKIKIIKRSIDSRDKQIFIVFSIYVKLSKPNKYKHLLKDNNIKEHELKEELFIPKVSSKYKPIVVGFGPSGMFCALLLARAGLNPVIIEQGKKVEDRVKDIEELNNNHKLNKHSNILFGEGGAGTFSDGKLTTGIKSEYIRFMLKELVDFGANENIYYDSKPHIGTDVLQRVVKNIREEIIKLGGSFYFSTQMIDFELNDSIYNVKLLDLNKNETFELMTNNLVLALGHSLRQNYQLLNNKLISMKPKNFSMGVRVEHKKEYIDKIQFKENYKHSKLRYSEYKLSAKIDEKRTIYTFCMCPGGEVVFSTNEENQVNINGMSYQKRDLDNSNSALLINVDIDDYYKDSILDGFDFIQKYERIAYNSVNEIKVPVQLLIDFINDKPSTKLNGVIPSCKVGYKFVELKNILPDFVSDNLRKGLKLLDNKMKGFISEDAVLTGIETRSSSPITIIRNEHLNSTLEGLYAIGEGSGYAGGITSSCVDGIKIALKIIGDLNNEK